MKRKFWCLILTALISSSTAFAHFYESHSCITPSLNTRQTRSAPVECYLVGGLNGWSFNESYRFSNSASSVNLAVLEVPNYENWGGFKIVILDDNTSKWYGCSGEISNGTSITLSEQGDDIVLPTSSEGKTITFTLNPETLSFKAEWEGGETSGETESPILSIGAENLTVTTGNTLEIPICLENPDCDVSAIQFDIVLPEGFAPIEEDGTIVVNRSYRATNSQHIAEASLNNNVLTINCHSTKDVPFSGNTGIVLTVPLNVNVAHGDYSISLTNVVLTEPSHIQHICESTSVTITVIQPETIHYTLAGAFNGWAINRDYFEPQYPSQNIRTLVVPNFFIGDTGFRVVGLKVVDEEYTDNTWYTYNGTLANDQWYTLVNSDQNGNFLDYNIYLPESANGKTVTFTLNTETLSLKVQWNGNNDDLTAINAASVDVERPILIRSTGHRITIRGTRPSEIITVCDINGTEVLRDVATDSIYCLPIDLPRGHVYVITIGGCTIKYAL